MPGSARLLCKTITRCRRRSALCGGCTFRPHLTHRASSCAAGAVRSSMSRSTSATAALRGVNGLASSSAQTTVRCSMYPRVSLMAS
ncbi:UNVERIFIED_CONTAM: hypothetical protein GTU68_028192 [Idotea baltica]|nr:hypothetical protein [Idotea baltica]